MQSIVTFTKKIKDPAISYKEIVDMRDIEKIGEVIHKLECLSGIRNSTLSQLGLRTNPKNWVSASLIEYPTSVRKQEMEYLIADFTDSMQTRMREESKYALGVLMQGKLILCHSVYGEETITPEWKTIPRMLDTDNVSRFVCFSCEKDEIVVSYWEREATSSFTDWLGLSRKQVFLLGGKYRIRTEIDNVSVEWQLDEDEIKNWLLTHPEIKDGKIDLPDPIYSLIIKEIRAGRKLYTNTKDFIQDYEAESFGIPRYQKEYQKIKSNNLPLLMKFHDDKEKVMRVEGDDKTVEVGKTTIDFNILFADGDIEIRPSYLAEIANKIKNKEQQKIVHEGHKFSTPPLSIGGTQIYSQIHLNAAVRLIIDYYNETHLQDRYLNLLLLYSIYEMLSIINRGSPLSYIFEEISNELIARPMLQGKISKTEDGILEYKSRDILAGRHEKIVDDFGEDIEVKLKSSPCKVYCIGIEDDGSLSSINSSRIRSDRLERIKQGLLSRFPSCEITLLPITYGEDALLILIVFERALPDMRNGKYLQQA